MHSAMRSLSNNLYYFSPECARLICEHWRKNSVKSLIKDWNQEHGLQKKEVKKGDILAVECRLCVVYGNGTKWYYLFERTDKIHSNGIM